MKSYELWSAAIYNGVQMEDMALVVPDTLAITEAKEPQTGSLWILKVWMGTIVLGFLAGAWYGQWLPRLCQKAWMGVSSKAQRAWTGGATYWVRLRKSIGMPASNGRHHLEAQVTSGNRRGSFSPPTEAMVRERNRGREGGQAFHFSGKGGWMPWTSRWLGTGTQQAQVYQPKVIGGQKEGKGGGKSREPNEPGEPSRDAQSTRECAGGVKDARGGKPQSSRKRNVNWQGMTNLLSSKEWKRKAVANLRGKMFAKSTLASRASKRKRLCDILLKVKGDKEFFPLEAGELELVGAVLSEAELKAGEQYINEVKLMQLEAGWAWDEVLERQLAMVKRALRRDVGPDRRAKEVKPEGLAIEDPKEVDKQGEGIPAFPKMSYVFAAVWMLRSGEVVSLDSGHLDLDPEGKKVSLLIPKSKMDQSKRGVKRTLTCCGHRPCRSTCPWRISVRVKNYMAGPSDEDPLIADSAGGRITRFQLVKAWVGHVDETMSGHSARRSGAMFYTRERWSLADLMFLGRWKSAAVFRYMEEAMAELPVNDTTKECKKAEPAVPVVNVEEEDAPVTVKGPAIKAQGPNKKPLWAVSISSRGKVAHRVGKASWGMPIAEWTTMCGWHFARNNARVELTRFKELHINCCQKCKGLHTLRDGVKGGVELAQLVEI